MEKSDTSSTKIKLEEKLSRLEKFVRNFPCENPTPDFMTKLFYTTKIVRQLNVSAFSFHHISHFPLETLEILSDLNIPIKNIAEEEITKIKTELELLPIQDERIKNNRRIIIKLNELSEKRGKITDFIDSLTSTFSYFDDVYVPDFLTDILASVARSELVKAQRELDSYSFEKASKNVFNPPNDKIELITNLSSQIDGIKRVVHDLTNGEDFISRKLNILKLPMKAAAEEELSKINMILSSYSINKE